MVIFNQKELTISYRSMLIDSLSDNFLEMMIRHPLASEGTFGFKQTRDGLHFIGPSFLFDNNKFSSEKAESTLKKKKTGCLAFLKPVFLPINVTTNDSIFSFIQQAFEKEDGTFTLYFQRLSGSWRNRIISEYESFLEGNDKPLSDPIGRFLQEGICGWINKLSGGSFQKRNRIDECEAKILEPGFLFFGELHGVSRITLQRLNKQLSEWDYLNGLRFQEQPNDFPFISESEIKSLLLGMAPIMKTPSLPKPINTFDCPETIQLLPVKEYENYQVDETLIKKIQNAMERVKIIKSKDLLIMSSVERGPTLQKTVFDIPIENNFTDFTKKEKDIKAALGIELLTIQQGDTPGTIAFVTPCDNTQVILLGNLMKTEEYLDHMKKSELPFVIGTDELGIPKFGDLFKLKHLMLGGATGSGKSVWERQFILSLLLSVPIDKLALYLIDPKKVEFGAFEGFPQVEKIVTDMSEAERIFYSLTEEMEKRYDFLSEKGYRSMQAYNKDHPKDVQPFIVIVVDEYSDLIMQYPDVENYIERLGQKARGAGIHIVIATQYPKSDIISPIIKSNLPSVISFMLKTNTEYRTIFGSGIPYKLLGGGDGAAKLYGQRKEFERFQGPAIAFGETNELSEAAELKVFDRLKEMFNDPRTQSAFEIVPEEKPIDKLKSVIAETRETRVTQLQQLLNIRQNTVVELMSELVKDGWLYKHKARSKGYELIVDEEELNKWKKTSD